MLFCSFSKLPIRGNRNITIYNKTLHLCSTVTKVWVSKKDSSFLGFTARLEVFVICWQSDSAVKKTVAQIKSHLNLTTWE